MRFPSPKLYRLNPSIVNFTAGVCVTVAVTLLTSVTLAKTGLWSQIYLVSIPWALAGSCLSLGAGRIDMALRDAYLRFYKNIPEKEKNDVLEDCFKPINRRTWILLGLAIGFVALALYSQVVFVINA